MLTKQTHEERIGKIPTPFIGLSPEETQKFSILRAIRAIAMGNREEAAFELDASRTVGEQMDSDSNPNMIHVPGEVLVHKRDMTTDVSTAGGFLVGQQMGSMIELLRNSMMVARMGATVLDDLQGDLKLPKQTGGATAYWVGENEAPSKSQQSVGQVGMTPHSIAAWTDLSRRLVLQTGGSAEDFVRRDLSTILALGVDLAAILGTGVDGQPRGILNTTGIGSVVGGTDGAAPTWAHIVGLESTVTDANALTGSAGYLTSSKIVGKLKTTQKGTNLPFIIDERNTQDGFVTMNGYRVGVSNQIPTNIAKGSGTNLSYILFGNWADLVIGHWGSLDILVDPFSLSSNRGLRVTVFRDVDLVLRNPVSFSAMLDADPA